MGAVGAEEHEHRALGVLESRTANAPPLFAETSPHRHPGLVSGGNVVAMSFIVILVIAIALAFDFTSGFHDTATAMATSVAMLAWRCAPSSSCMASISSDRLSRI